MTLAAVSEKKSKLWRKNNKLWKNFLCSWHSAIERIHDTSSEHERIASICFIHLRYNACVVCWCSQRRPSRVTDIYLSLRLILSDVCIKPRKNSKQIIISFLCGCATLSLSLFHSEYCVDDHHHNCGILHLNAICLGCI